jgi:hypothetical protein
MRMALTAIIFLTVLLTVGCFSGATFQERYQQTPAKAESSYQNKEQSQGSHLFQFTYKDRKWVAVRLPNGKYQVIKAVEETK